MVVRQGSGTEALDWPCFTLADGVPAQRVWLGSSELARGRIDGATAVEPPAGAPEPGGVPGRA